MFRKLRFKPVVLIAIFLIECISSHVFAANWQNIPPQQVHSLIKEGSGILLIDVRNEIQFQVAHIEGAMNIPLNMIANKHFAQRKSIVVIDDSLGLYRGQEAATILLRNNSENKVFALEGGIPAWQNQGYPLVGTGNSRIYRAVMPDEMKRAQENAVPLKIYDLRGKEEQLQVPVPQAQSVEGPDITARMLRLKEMLPKQEKKGLAGKLQQSTSMIIIFPTSANARTLMERFLQDVPGDLRYLEAGYAAWAARPNKNIPLPVCPTCPRTPEGEKQ